MIRLVDLVPRFVGNTKGERIGFSFLCPKCRKQRIVAATPPWKRNGDDFEKMTLDPSLDANPGHAHFEIKEGKIIMSPECKATCV